MLEQALRLSVEDRAELVARLLESLDETAPDPDPDPEHDAAWTEVIDRRLQDIREGRVEPCRPQRRHIPSTRSCGRSVAENEGERGDPESDGLDEETGAKKLQWGRPLPGRIS